MTNASGESARHLKYSRFRAVLTVFAAGILVLSVIALIYLVREGQARREQAILIIAAELDRLPPPGDVAEAQRIVLTDLGRGPSINVVYPQVGSCDDVQAYYDRSATAQRWTYLNTQHVGYDIIDTYSKEASGYRLVLSVDCVRDDAPVPHGGFTLSIHG